MELKNISSESHPHHLNKLSGSYYYRTKQDEFTVSSPLHTSTRKDEPVAAVAPSLGLAGTVPSSPVSDISPLQITRTQRVFRTHVKDIGTERCSDNSRVNGHKRHSVCRRDDPRNMLRAREPDKAKSWVFWERFMHNKVSRCLTHRSSKARRPSTHSVTRSSSSSSKFSSVSSEAISVKQCLLCRHRGRGWGTHKRTERNCDGHTGRHRQAYCTRQMSARRKS